LLLIVVGVILARRADSLESSRGPLITITLFLEPVPKISTREFLKG
jgi:hypothetical protein